MPRSYTYSAPWEIAAMAAPDYYVAFHHGGIGKRRRVECATLAEAGAAAMNLEATSGSGRRAMVYAIQGERRAAYVPREQWGAAICR